jgi:hypothetical protein
VVKRYAIASLIILIVAGATAGVAYKTGSKLTYQASCADEVFVRAPATSTAQPTPDFLSFTNSLAATQVQLATPKVYVELATSQHATPGDLAANLTIAPAPGIGTFRVIYTASDPGRAKKVVNAACDSYVSVIKKQRADELNGDIATIQARLVTLAAEVKKLSAIPPKKRTTQEQIALQTQTSAYQLNTFLLSSLRSLPPDNVEVLTPAAGAVGQRSASLKKYLLIALLGALLAIFLFILVVEALSPSPSLRRFEQPAPDDMDDARTSLRR